MGNELRVVVSCNKSMANIANSHLKDYSNCLYMDIDFSYDLYNSFQIMTNSAIKSEISEILTRVKHANEIIVIIDEINPYDEFFGRVCIYLAMHCTKAGFMFVRTLHTNTGEPIFDFRFEELNLQQIIDNRDNINDLSITNNSILYKNYYWYALHSSSLDSYIIPRLLESNYCRFEDLLFDILMDCRKRYHFLFSDSAIFNRLVKLCKRYNKIPLQSLDLDVNNG